MAIDPVDGFGQITKSNAKEIYKAYRKGTVELDAGQQKKVESFLSSKDLDEIDYDSGVANKDGKDQLGDDVKNAQDHGGQGGNAVGCTAGNITSVLSTIALAYVAVAADGFTAIALGAAAAACAGLSILFSKLFDNGYDDRTAAQGNADSTNELIDNNKDVLEESMAAMDDDLETYQEQSDDYTNKVNDATANSADLEAQLADAEAAGDVEGAQQLKEELKQIKEEDFETEQEEMDETRGMLEEYKYSNDIAGGVSEGGQIVSDFLKEGTALGVVAAINSAILTLASVTMAMVAAGQMPKIAPFFPDVGSSIGAKALYAVCGGLFGFSASIMIKKTKGEFECGSSGRDMQQHVNDLNSMREQQDGYMESTSEDYDGVDEDSEESQDKAKEAAEKANKNRQGGVGPVNKKEEEEDNKTNSGNNRPSVIS